MSLEITFRPQKDLYVNNPPSAYDEAYYNSRWVAGHLPIQYKISNTKWPENTEDDVNNICAVSDINGFAQLNICGTYETYVKYEYIKIENSTVGSYNGVWQILNVVNSTTLTISAAYNGTATGTVQRYYNNYHNLVKVYAGIPSYHQYDSEDPMSLIATLKIFPNSDNISIADISGLIQAKLNCDNDRDQISAPNDLNAWTGFYIQYAESYDQSDGATVSQFTSTYTTDNNDNCEVTNIIQNGDFAANLDSWTNGYTGSDFVYDSGKASATRGANSASKILYQSVNFLQGVPYAVSASITNSESSGLRVFISLYTSSALDTSTRRLIHTSGLSGGTTPINFVVVPSSDYPVIGIVFQYFGSTTQKASLDNISATAIDCAYYGFAINGTRQLQNTIGGNFGDYVQNFNFHVFDNKFLTHFEEPVWFNGLYFDISTIIPKPTFDATDDRSLFYSINEYTSSRGFIQRQDIELDSKDDGVYRLPISDLSLDAQTEEFDIQIYQLPSNKMTQGAGGDFEYTADTGGNPPSDWGLSTSLATSLARSSSYAHSGTFSLRSIIPSVGQGISTIWRTTGGFTVFANSEYIIEGYVLIENSEPPYDGSSIYLTSPTSGVNVTVVETFTAFTTGEVWYYLKSAINTGGNTSIDISAVISAPGNIAENASFFWDTITVKGPLENLSEIKTIKVDNSCTKQNIYMTWLNNLGAWEYYNFKAEKDYSVEFGETKKITRDPFNNWDTDFINGETQDDYISIEAFDSVTVRSQFMALEELQAVSKIKYAIRVQEIREDDTKITVLVDKKSFKTYSDGDKLYAIEFNISYPNIQIQRQ
jgi:hypothetical protein